MKMRISELRDMIRKELGRDSLALYTHEETRHTPEVRVMLYSPDAVLDDFTTFMSKSFLNDEDATGVVKGYARFKQPDNACAGAWEVASIAGRGLGKLLYGLGYDLSPNGRLMPDRSYNSPDAQAAWARAAGKGLKGFPLDDVNAPEDMQLTPGDPDDDCDLKTSIEDGGPDPIIDFAYEGGGVGAGKVRELVTAHERFVSVLDKDKQLPRADFEAWLLAAGKDKFRKDFGY